MKCIIHVDERHPELRQVSNVKTEKNTNVVIVELQVTEGFDTGYDYMFHATSTREYVAGGSGIHASYRDYSLHEEGKFKDVIEFEFSENNILNVYPKGFVSYTISRKKAEESDSAYVELVSGSFRIENQLYAENEWCLVDNGTNFELKGTSTSANGVSAKTMKLGGIVTMGASAQYFNLGLSNYSQVGTDITAGLDDTYNVYGIKIGKNVNQILLTSHATFQNNNDTSAMSFAIQIERYRNGEHATVTIGRTENVPAASLCAVSVPGIVANAIEGDIFVMRVYKNMTAGKAECLSSYNRTYLTAIKIG